jgi:enterochelin esterase-like enzyme
VETLLEQAQRGTPIIAGNAATFVWQGADAPKVIGDWSDWESGTPRSLTKVAPDVWAHTASFPGDTYMEYAFIREGKRLNDPLNPHRTPNGMGSINNYFYMPDGGPTPLIRRQRGVPHGTVARHVLENDFLLVGGKRAVDLYRPPAGGPCPLLVVLDGQDYRHRGKLVNIVDNLIAQGRIQPVALALPHHAGRARGVEYACSEAHLGFLSTQVLPLAQKELNLVDLEASPGAYGILGASMGGLMALYAGLRAPHIFGHVLSQSGAFTLDVHDTVVWDLVEQGPIRPIQIWMDAGHFEWLLPCNRRMQETLAARGYEVTYHEYNAGHNYPAWRNDVWRGLELLFGPAADQATTWSAGGHLRAGEDRSPKSE